MTLTADDIALIRLEINDLDSRIFTDDDINRIATKHDTIDLVIADLLELILTRADYWQNFTGGNLNYNPNSVVINRIKEKIQRLRADIQTEYITYHQLPE